jgi:hypothetical protein
VWSKRQCTRAGFWKGAVVAVKVIVHDASMARKVDALRESLVGISMQHPHVVKSVVLQLSRLHTHDRSAETANSAV